MIIFFNGVSAAVHYRVSLNFNGRTCWNIFTSFNFHVTSIVFCNLPK